MTIVAPDQLAELVWAALETVNDPELDEPITALGFVRSCEFIDGAGDLEGCEVEVHLRLPTSFCSPSFAYLMAGDAQDVVRAVPGVRRVLIVLDGHHDSDRINRGLAAQATFLDVYGNEAEEDLDELRLTFQRKAHTAAMERVCSTWLTEGSHGVEDLAWLTLADLPEGREKAALLRRRFDIGLPTSPHGLVVVDDLGEALPVEDIPLKLRFARTVRISMDGNAHFCRGLLRTRYPSSPGDQAPRAQDSKPRATTQKGEHLCEQSR